MDAVLKAQWVAALRSGKYTQGFGSLRMVLENPRPDVPCHCCLGVLCDLVNPYGWDRYGRHNGIHSNKDYRYDFRVACLPESIVEFTGLHTMFAAIDLPGVKKITLADLNDARFTFEQIADVIEWAL